MPSIQVRYASLTEAIRLLGCFGSEVNVESAVAGVKTSDETFGELFYNIYGVLDGLVTNSHWLL